MFDNSPDAKWSREFGELGEKRVRELMLSTSWDQEKRVAARRWLEKQDVKVWQARQVAKAETDEAFSLKAWIRDNRKWVLLIMGAGIAMMFLSRLFR